MLGPIKYIELQNWVSYANGRFDFHPNVNMIIGPSGHGKSAMMAAFFKLFYNRPTGDEFVSWWGGETKLIMAMDDWVLGYSKKKSKASYSLMIADQLTTFSAFGASVPDEISRLLCISDELNIQKQFKKKAPIFLLSETPGDAAKKLNTFANLTGIDATIQAGRSDIKESNKAINHLEDQLDMKEKELMNYQGLDDLDILITQAEKKKNLIKKCSLKIDAIEKILNHITNLKNEQKEIQKWGDISTIISRIPFALERLYSYQRKIEKITERLTTITALRRGWDDTAKFMKLLPFLKKYGEKVKQIEIYDAQLEKLFLLENKIKFRRITIKGYKNKAKKLQVELKRNFPDICPLCHGKVNKDLL